MTRKPQEKQNNDSALRKEVLSVGKHSMIYVVGEALSRGVGFFMIPIYTRFIAPTNYGALDLIEILVGTIAMIVSMGVSDGMSRFYYAEKDQTKRNKVVSTVIIGFGVIGIPIVAVFLALAGFISDIVLEEAQYQYCLQIAVITVWFGMLCEVGYSYLRMRYMARTFVAVTTTQLLVAVSLNIYFVVFLKLNILGIFYSTLITQSLTGVFLSAAILRQVRLRVSMPVLWNLVRFGLPLVPSRIGLMLGFVSNRFFLRYFASPDSTIALAQVGLFSLGHKFGVIVNRFFNVPFNSFWGPRRLELILSNKPAARESVARICTYATMCSIYLALILSSGIESLIEIIADPRYRGAHLVVPYVALSYVALGLETHFTSGILYSKRTKWLSYITACSLFIVLLWNYLFVPSYGLLGAATANLAGFAVRVTLIYIVSQRLFPIPFEIGRLACMFLTASALYALSQAISFASPYLTFLARTTFVALFPVFLFVTRFYRKGELDYIAQTLRKVLKALQALHPPLRRT